MRLPQSAWQLLFWRGTLELQVSVETIALALPPQSATTDLSGVSSFVVQQATGNWVHTTPRTQAERHFNSRKPLKDCACSIVWM